MTSIAITWVGMPDYAARCVRKLVEEFDGSVEVVSTRPSVPIEGMERSLGKPVHWVEGGLRGTRWADLELAPPDLLLQGGYYLPTFAALAKEVQQAGGKVVLGSDNNWQGTLLQKLVEPVMHRVMLRGAFDGVMTTGASGVRYSRAMGYPADCIATGVYGADPELFNGGKPLVDRPKNVLFVGQLIERKNVLGLARAFIRIRGDHPDWTLTICGSGAQRDELPHHPAIDFRDFVQPPQLAEIMREARCLVLPSREEHWGVVIHEATLSGCALALSATVGAADDFARPSNSVLFPPGDEAAMEMALRRIVAWTPQQWTAAEAASRERGASFGPTLFSSELRRLFSLLVAAGETKTRCLGSSKMNVERLKTNG